jgi:hypothetical protein
MGEDLLDVLDLHGELVRGGHRPGVYF